MTTFEYKGFRRNGRATRGLVEASDLKEAREKLAAAGVLSERVMPAGTGRHRRPAFDLDARSSLYRELSALLEAGLPLSQAIKNLLDAPELGSLHGLLAAVHDRIREGGSFADAMGRTGSEVRPFEQAAMVAGERSGDLGGALNRLAGFLEEQRAWRDRVQTAMIYPAVVLGMAALVTLLMFGIMVPRFGGLLAEAGVELPFMTRCLVALGRAAGPVLLVLALVAAGITFLVRRRLRADAGFRVRCNRMLFRLPWVGRGYTALAGLRFARTLSLLLTGGTGLVEGMRLAGRATGSPWIEELTAKEAEALRHGSSLADAMRRIPPLGAALAGWVQAGETGGGLTGLLDHAAKRQQRQWERLTARALQLLEPALLLLVGGMVLVLALALLAPVLALNRGLM